MTIDPRFLRNLVAGSTAAVAEPEPEPPPLEVPQPAPWGVTYAQQNPDGSRKNCRNCALWVMRDGGRCAIHHPDILVKSDAVCGYHVPGRPSNTPPKLVVLQPVNPASSGLERVPGGTSCDLCAWWSPDGEDGDVGHCFAVAGYDGGPAPVEARACCSRWEAAEPGDGRQGLP